MYAICYPISSFTRGKLTRHWVRSSAVTLFVFDFSGSKIWRLKIIYDLPSNFVVFKILYHTAVLKMQDNLLYACDIFQEFAWEICSAVFSFFGQIQLIGENCEKSGLNNLVDACNIKLKRSCVIKMIHSFYIKKLFFCYDSKVISLTIRVIILPYFWRSDNY